MAPQPTAYYSGEAMFDLDRYLERIGLAGRPGIAEVHRDERDPGDDGDRPRAAGGAIRAEGIRAGGECRPAPLLEIFRYGQFDRGTRPDPLPKTGGLPGRLVGSFAASRDRLSGRQLTRKPYARASRR
jgi:hypothetical protein